MSRRCDREGVAWPRLAPREGRLARAGMLDVLWSTATLRGVYGFDHVEGLRGLTLRHLRERPVLP